MLISYFILLIFLLLSVPMIYCIAKSDRYTEYVKVLNNKEFPVSSLYGIGFAMVDLFKIEFKSDQAHKIRENARVLFGKKYTEFYLRVAYAQTFTFCYIILYLSGFFGCLVKGLEGLILVIIGSVVAIIIYRYYINNYQNKINELNILYMKDFPNAVSTIALLVNAGMFLRDAWKQVAFSSDSPLYMQMRLVVDDMNNGISESDAIFAFANRCSTKEIRKFSTLVTQAIEKGGRDLTDSLTKQADLLINEKKQLVLQEGEKASNKLMGPIAFIFVGVIIMIIVPIISNMNMG